MKRHVTGLELVLANREADLQQMTGRNVEAQQELESMSHMRLRLNEHIVYL